MEMVHLEEKGELLIDYEQEDGQWMGVRRISFLPILTEKNILWCIDTRYICPESIPYLLESIPVYSGILSKSVELISNIPEILREFKLNQKLLDEFVWRGNFRSCSSRR